MHDRSELLQKHSRVTRDAIVEWVGHSQERFGLYMKWMLQDAVPRVQENAASVVSHCIEQSPQLIEPHLPALLQHLQQPSVSAAIKRNAMRLLQFVTVPESLHGLLMNSCFSLLENPKEAVAVKAFALTVLGTLAEQYPDIVHELQAIIDAQLDDQSPAFQHRAKSVLTQLKRINAAQRAPGAPPQQG